MTSNTKIFGWFEGDHSGNFLKPRQGPYFDHNAQLIGGRALEHKLEDLLKCNFSASIKKRLSTARPGTVIKIHYVHSNGSMFLKNLADTEVQNRTALNIAQELLQRTNQDILDATPALHQQKADLEKKIRKLKEKIF